MGSRSLFILLAIAKCIDCLPAEAWLSITLLASVFIQSSSIEERALIRMVVFHRLRQLSALMN